MASHRSLGRAAIITLTALLGSCGGEENPGAAGVTQQGLRHGVAESDQQIAALLYAGIQRTPVGFASDAPPEGPGYVATYHVQNTQLAAASDRHELCTEDWNQALQWSDVAGGIAEVLVGNSSTERYFEFQRVRNSTPMINVRARVYRCSYLDRSAVDLADEQGAAGTLNLRPIDAARLRELAEYLWHFTRFNNADHAVLHSRGAAIATGLQHELLLAQLERAAAGGCDRLSVWTWRHQVDLFTGGLRREFLPLWEFGARQIPGGVALC